MNGCGVRVIGPNNYVPKLIVNLICVPPIIWIHFRGTPTVSTVRSIVSGQGSTILGYRCTVFIDLTCIVFLRISGEARKLPKEKKTQRELVLSCCEPIR